MYGHSVDGFRPAPGELIESLYDRKTGVFDAVECCSVVAEVDLAFDKSDKIVKMAISAL